MELELKRVKHLLPSGTIARLSEKAGMKPGDISKMLSGYETKRTPEVVELVKIILHNQLIELEALRNLIEQ